MRQLHLRAESEAAESKERKAELEAAQAEHVSLQKTIGLLRRKNEDLASENGEGARCAVTLWSSYPDTAYRHYYS